MKESNIRSAIKRNAIEKKMLKVSACFFTFLAAFVFIVSPINAQVTTCKTGNCTAGNVSGSPILPAECQKIAAPRIIEITMSNTPSLRFTPSNPRIEGESTTPGAPWDFQCVKWHKTDSSLVPWHSASEDTTGSGCSTATACSSANITPPCDWEAGNIDSALAFSTCHYAKVAPGSYHFRCRLHNASGMNGTMTVVSPIVLLVKKNVNGDVILDWANGGVGPWDVWSDSSAAMTAASNLTPAGTINRTFTDPVPAGNVIFYLVMERN